MGENFRQIANALANKQLETADVLTRALICDLAGEDLPVTPEVVEKLAEEHLESIDKLWLEGSGGKFGLSVQSRIWIEIGCPAKIFRYEDMPDYQRWSLGEYEFQFGFRVGWARKPRSMKDEPGSGDWGWLGCSYDEQLMVEGSLPYVYLMCSYGHGLIGLVAAAVAARFADKIA